MAFTARRQASRTRYLPKGAAGVTQAQTGHQVSKCVPLPVLGEHRTDAAERVDIPGVGLQRRVSSGDWLLTNMSTANTTSGSRPRPATRAAQAAAPSSPSSSRVAQRKVSCRPGNRCAKWGPAVEAAQLANHQVPVCLDGRHLISDLVHVRIKQHRRRMYARRRMTDMEHQVAGRVDVRERGGQAGRFIGWHERTAWNL